MAGAGEAAAAWENSLLSACNEVAGATRGTETARGTGAAASQEFG